MFGTYAKTNQNVQFSLFGVSSGPNPTGEREFITQNARATKSAVGAAASIGLQWQPSSIVALGLTLRSPEMAFSASTEGGAVIATANAGGTEPADAALIEQTPPPVDAAGKIVAPGRALAGVAFALGRPQSWIELGVDGAHGLPHSAHVDAQQPTVALVQDPSPEALVLVTTLSLRSFIGFGEARALMIDLDQPDGAPDVRSSVTFLEVMPYLGSAVVL